MENFPCIATDYTYMAIDFKQSNRDKMISFNRVNFAFILRLIAALSALIGIFATFRLWLQIDIESFSISPPTIEQGERVRLDWKVGNVSNIEILPNIGKVSCVGSRTDNPIKTTLYRLIVKKFIFKKEAEFEVLVTPVANFQKQYSEYIDFSKQNEVKFLHSDDLFAIGIKNIEASPIGIYCKSSQPVIVPPGRFSHSYGALTTARPGKLEECGGVPLAISFNELAKEVILRFFGADTKYKLTAYSADGAIIGSSFAEAKYGDFGDFEIRVASKRTDISSIIFGHQAAITLIRDIQVVH